MSEDRMRRCSESYCFKDEHVLRFDVFDDCWKKLVNGVEQKSTILPADVDFIIEQRGNILLMEWKHHSGVFKADDGQGIMWRKLVKRAPITIVLCEGSARTMTIKKLELLHAGYDSGVLDTDMDGLKRILSKWSRWAERNPVPEDKQLDAGVPFGMPEDYAKQIQVSVTA